jgi:hypothetical protein
MPIMAEKDSAVNGLLHNLAVNYRTDQLPAVGVRFGPGVPVGRTVPVGVAVPPGVPVAVVVGVGPFVAVGETITSVK